MFKSFAFTHYRNLLKSIRLGAGILIFIIIPIFSMSCRAPETSTSTDATNWADHDVSLEQNNQRFRLVLETQSSVQEIDSNTPWQLYAISEREGLKGRRWSVFYVDQSDPDTRNLASYTYGLSVERVVNAPNTFDVSLTFYRDTVHSDLTPDFPGRSPRHIYLGRARFNGNQNLAPIDFGSQTPLFSTIRSAEDFVGNGQLALHYLTSIEYAVPAPLEDCRTELENCVSIAVASVCPRGIMTPDCLPRDSFFRFQDVIDESVTTESMKTLGKAQFLVVEKDLTTDDLPTLTFTSQSIAVENDSNQELCASHVSYLATSGIDDRANSACTVKLEPSPEAADGKLSCRISVGFVNPRDVSDYVCNITAVFLADKKEFHTAQVLFQPRL